MKRFLLRVLILFFLLSPIFSFSQNLTGIWRGYFINDDGVEYKFELQILQKGNSVSGVSYSYHTTDFYGKAILTGSFNKTGQSALIQEIKTVELRMASGNSACIMKCFFQYARSGREEFLEGTFSSKNEKDNKIFGIKKGDDCGGGKVYLRKVITSDFYIEPFLRNKIKQDSINALKNLSEINNPDLIKKQSAKKTMAVIKKPTPKKTSPSLTHKTTLNKKTNTIVKQPVKKPATNSLTKVNTPPAKIIGDPAKKIDSPAINPDISKQISIKPNVAIPEVLKTRENKLVRTLVVTSPDITVKLYDNGIVDGDTISVYLDKKLLLSRKGLSEVPIVMHLKMDEDNNEHELVMVAENLGSIPPNTSMMIVEAGDKQYNVYIESTEQRNAVVKFRYEKQ